MDDLPELPFEKVLSYLNLQDRLRLSSVSRSCHEKIHNRRVKSLCYSQRPLGFIIGKRRLISGAFAQNFISSTRFITFFDAFGQTILSSLNHLRLCDLSLDLENQTAFTRTLNSFDRLEQLDIIRAKFSPKSTFELNLPMLSSLQLECLSGIKKLTLDAPRLREVKVLKYPEAYASSLKLYIVHGESVERLIISDQSIMTQSAMKKLVNLNYLYTRHIQSLDPTFLSSLKELKEIHLDAANHLLDELFEQKQRYGLVDLKIYLGGFLLNGPDDPVIHSLLEEFDNETFHRLASNPSRLADQIPFWHAVNYSAIEQIVAPGSETSILNRFTGLNRLIVTKPVPEVQRFLDFLKIFDNIICLEFWSDQPQDLFDQLPEHCAVQRLMINYRVSDVRFLFRLKNLIHLDVRRCKFDAQSILEAFEELPVLSSFESTDFNKFTIKIVHPNQFRVSVDFKEETVSNLNAAIQFITKKLAIVDQQC